MKVLIIGGVAAGTKTAAKLKRMNRSADITLLSRDKDISYAGCGLPYYVGNSIESRDDLIVNTPEKYAALTGVTVHTGREAFRLDKEHKTVYAKNLDTGAEEVYSYDCCVISTGASSIMPALPGIESAGVLKLPKTFCLVVSTLPSLILPTKSCPMYSIPKWRPLLKNICKRQAFAFLQV